MEEDAPAYKEHAHLEGAVNFFQTRTNSLKWIAPLL